MVCLKYVSGLLYVTRLCLHYTSFRCFGVIGGYDRGLRVTGPALTTRTMTRAEPTMMATRLPEHVAGAHVKACHSVCNVLIMLLQS